MTWLAWLPVATPVITLLAACIALATYRMNAKTRRAEFLTALHRDFFIEQHYRKIRDLVDEPRRSAEVASLIAVQDSSLIDFLNFFEHAAYLVKVNVLSRADVEAGFGYYLRVLRQSSAVSAYIGDPSRSFEHLRNLLGKLEKRT